ncbi:MAG: gamma-glutamyl-gamma-aminobutyrate hydrolase family protein, partial [bacterium]
GNFFLPGDYVDAVRMAGGVPVLLPPGEADPAAVFNRVDGLIFSGGGDFAPEVYGGKPHPSISRVDPERDTFELSLAKHALAREKPVLGICRGFQLLNIVSGGDLLADVPEKYGQRVAHRNECGGQTEHEVELSPESRLAQITGHTRISVVSKHHQALDRIAPGWEVVARADDGVVEALEAKNHPWMTAVLWHPELALRDPNQRKIFDDFVRAARAD